MKQVHDKVTTAASSVWIDGPAKPQICMHVLGIGRTDARVLREAHALAEAGYDITIVDIEVKKPQAGGEVHDDLHYRHLHVPTWNTPTRFKPWFLVRMTQVILRGTIALLRTPADAYHAHEDNALFACYIAATVWKKPLIFDAHELPFVSPNVTRWRMLHSIAVRLLRGMMHRCTAVLSPSPPLIHELQRRYGGPEAVLIRNISPYYVPVASDRIRQTLHLRAEQRIVLYQGGMLADRGLDVLVRAARFVDPQVVIVFMGRGESQSSLEDLVAQEGLGDRVMFLPPVPYTELIPWTASADLGLIVYRAGSPNVPMQLPNKLFEYMMAGVPVLASPLEAVKEIVNTYHVGQCVDSLDPSPEEVAKAINAMLGDDEMRAHMRQNALAASQTELRWDVESQRLVKLYQTILIEPPANEGAAQ